MSNFVQIEPQDAFMSNSRFNEQTEIGSEITIMHWSQIGTIQLRKAEHFTSIDVEFSDKNFHRNF